MWAFTLKIVWITIAVLYSAAILAIASLSNDEHSFIGCKCERFFKSVTKIASFSYTAYGFGWPFSYIFLMAYSKFEFTSKFA